MAIYWLFMGIVASFSINSVDDYEHGKKGNQTL
jgi:hypothetical protein